MKVLNMGSLNIDYVYKIDHIVQAGETIASNGMNIYLGGKGFNQSVALAKAGVEVYHAGLIGEDGRVFLDECEKYGIQSDYIKIIPGKSGHTIIQVDQNAQNCIILYGGSNRQIKKEYVDEVLEHFEQGDFLLLQNEINELPYIINQAYKKGMRIILNPSPYDHNLEQCDLTKVSYFLLNEIEGEQLTGSSEPDVMLKRMMQQFPNAKIVLTLGSRGAVYCDQNGMIEQEIYKVKAVDTTAAGDTFTGYFIAGLKRKMRIQEILKMCAKASAIAVSREGASPSIPTFEEVENDQRQER